MPGAEPDLLVPTPSTLVQVAIEPVHNALASLMLLIRAEQFSGFDDWVMRMHASLPQSLLHTNRVVLEGLYYAIVPTRRFASFPEYVDALEAEDPRQLRDRLLHRLASPCTKDAPRGARVPLLIAPRRLLESVEAYLHYLRTDFPNPDIDEAIETEAYNLFIDPPLMQEVIVRHMRTMWQEVLEPEWRRVLPLLQESAAAFQQVDVSNLTPIQAIESITGRPLDEKWHKAVHRSQQVYCVPSAHSGPYLVGFLDPDTLWLVFGARLPEGGHRPGSALDRSELLVRLNALADDTRLSILALLSEHGELCAQEVMAMLDLSQSAASRHLRQLSATGYITERRRDGNKCYTLNRERFDQTFQAFARFLAR